MSGPARASRRGTATTAAAASVPVDLRALVARAERDGDPFGGLRDPADTAACLLAAGDRLPLYLALSQADVAAAARSLAWCWRQFGVRRGDHVLIYDYGTSPLTLFASWCYVPGLRQGAADLLGAVPICNDGLPEFAPRALHVLRYLRPRVTFVDGDVMPSFVRQAAEEQFPVRDHTALVVVSADEEVPEPAQVAAWSATIGVPVRALLRSTPMLFFAAQCDHGALHANPAFYRVEVEASAPPTTRLCITTRFLRPSRRVRYLTGIAATTEHAGCACGAPGIAFRCAS